MRLRRSLILAAMVLAMGAVQASGQKAQLRISLTIVDRCEVRSGSAIPSIACTLGVPWAVATPAAAPAVAPSVQPQGQAPSMHYPVPGIDPASDAAVTTIVF